MSIEARFRIRRGAFTLDVRFRVPARGVTALFGPSGCGKTTLLRAVAGLERGEGGYFRLGDDVWEDGGRFVEPHRRPLGYVFQEASLFPHLTVRRNLEYGFKRTPPGERRVSFAEAVALLGLEPLLERRPAHLSGGERQRAAIARALLTSPRLLLMDEPLAALDLRSKTEILPFLERLHEELEIPVFYVSHSPDEVARLADHLVLIDSGRVLGAGPIGEMLTRVDLPLSQGEDAEALIEGRVVAYEREFHLNVVEFSGGRFTVAGEEMPVGRRVRLRVLARDVSLTLERQTHTSILNIFKARVEELSGLNAAQMIVRLDAGGVPILSRITRKSAVLLGIEPGREVHVQVKAVALLA
jgi:molybdate transport system ATP-binding protein